MGKGGGDMTGRHGTSVKRVNIVARVNAPRPIGSAVVLCASCQS